MAMVDLKPGDIDRTTEHEQKPFLERCETTSGVARELFELHSLIVEQQILPPGSDVAVRFSLLIGIATGTLWRLEDELGVERARRKGP